jgi:hypothetical protein
MIPSNHRTSTSPETLLLEDTALVRKPACESTRSEQSDEQNKTFDLSATACNAKDGWMLADRKRLKNLW